MNGIYYHPSDQTIKAIDHCRKEYAETKGVTRNAVDQLFAGNTHDAYPPFREQFKDVCLTQEADPDAYLNDLLSIKQSARGGVGIGVCDAFLDKLRKANRVIEVCAEALKDGELDKQECLAIIPLLSKTRDAAEVLLNSVMDRKNELAGASPVREFAKKAVEKRKV